MSCLTHSHIHCGRGCGTHSRSRARCGSVGNFLLFKEIEEVHVESGGFTLDFIEISAPVRLRHAVGCLAINAPGSVINAAFLFVLLPFGLTRFGWSLL